MPQRNFTNQGNQNTGGQHDHTNAPFQLSQASGRYTHEQKLDYATHVHNGTAAGAQQHIHAYSAPQGQQGGHLVTIERQGATYSQPQQSAGINQGYGNQAQAYRQQGQSSQQQQQMKQQIKQQYQGQYSQLSTKDFNYLKDHMSWELLAAKKCYHYAQECQDGQVANVINQMGQMHERHYNSLLQFFHPQNVQ